MFNLPHFVSYVTLIYASKLRQRSAFHQEDTRSHGIAIAAIRHRQATNIKYLTLAVELLKIEFARTKRNQDAVAYCTQYAFSAFNDLRHSVLQQLTFIKRNLIIQTKLQLG